MGKRRLTQRQNARIKHTQQERVTRAPTSASAQTLNPSSDDLGPEQPATVIANFGVSMEIRTDTGDTLTCNVRQNLGDIVCGDQVIWRSARHGVGIIVALTPRRSILSRADFHGQTKPVAANIDAMMIVIAPAPAASETLLDSYLVAAELSEIAPLIVVNKCDLLSRAERSAWEERLQPQRAAGYSVFYTDAQSAQGIEALHAHLKDSIGIVVGYSGVGKSSLVQRLLPDVDIAIGALSAATGLGKHTTTVTRMYSLPGGGQLIDSPGVRDFKLGSITAQQAAYGYPEFRPYLGQCKFKDCTHVVEPACAIRAAAQMGAIDTRRLASYERLLKQLHLI